MERPDEFMGAFPSQGINNSGYIERPHEATEKCRKRKRERDDERGARLCVCEDEQMMHLVLFNQQTTNFHIKGTIIFLSLNGKVSAVS